MPFSNPRELVIAVVVVLAPAAVVAILVGRDDPRAGLMLFAFVSVLSLLSFTVSRRLARRFAPPPATGTGRREPRPAAPSSERPEHAQRRRQRRRRGTTRR